MRQLLVPTTRSAVAAWDDPRGDGSGMGARHRHRGLRAICLRGGELAKNRTLRDLAKAHPPPVPRVDVYSRVTIEDEQHLMRIVLMADDQFRWTERLTD